MYHIRCNDPSSTNHQSRKVSVTIIIKLKRSRLSAHFVRTPGGWQDSPIFKQFTFLPYEEIKLNNYPSPKYKINNSPCLLRRNTTATREAE